MRRLQLQLYDNHITIRINPILSSMQLVCVDAYLGLIRYIQYNKEE